MRFEVEFERADERIEWIVTDPLTGSSVRGGTYDGVRPTREAMRRATKDAARSMMSYISTGAYHDIKEDGK